MIVSCFFFFLVNLLRKKLLANKVIVSYRRLKPLKLLLRKKLIDRIRLKQVLLLLYFIFYIRYSVFRIPYSIIHISYKLLFFGHLRGEKLKVVLYKKNASFVQKVRFLKSAEWWSLNILLSCLKSFFTFGTAIFRESDKFLISPLIFFPSNALATVVYRYWKKVRERTIYPRDSSLLIYDLKPSIS